MSVGALVGVLLATLTTGAPQRSPKVVPRPSLLELRPRPTRCCKHCTKGKPCGDACIAKDKVCTVGPGCAC
jgi:hypothetical protein